MYMMDVVLSVLLAVIFTVEMTYRCTLVKKIKHMKKIIKILRNLKSGKTSDNTLWLKVLIIINMSLEIALFTYRLLTGDMYQAISYRFFGYSFQENVYHDIVSVICEMYFVIFLYLPMTAFGFYYTAVCYDTKCIIKQFAASLLVEKSFNYENLLHDYSVIKSAVKKFDDTVGFLIFTTLIYNSCDLYFTLNVVLEASILDIAYLTYYNFFTSFTLIILMMASAASVADASSEVSSMAVTMPEDKGRSNFNHQRFITLADKEITLTAWKITPIRRNFIFGIVGILLTYTLMFQKLTT
ncbi:uncharacterized protein TNCT_521451 [Trichonephila clavata]|uniref:Gustatory receptor n=1 Tax=Trichonephila clavata TaxID=2740835 RepID=A0A8X6LAY6_TRICU|nr:uncharacterized protein TNCT_521451 [Trichonephila clavata]